ncbi:MAG TPA: class E sortase, partial [Acidimicrobiales bacterium]|nr:class E sortase [Acidimicrobiales bacterium]
RVARHPLSLRAPRGLGAVLRRGPPSPGGGAPAGPPAEAGDVVAKRQALRTAATSTTTTTVAPVTTAAPPLTARTATSPVQVPKNPYANEPLRQIGTIEIPKIGLRHPVFEGITLRTIDHGPGHWPGSAMPGYRGNAVFAGHRVTHSKPFRNIDQLRPGDQVIFDIAGRRSVYNVTGSKIVSPKQLDIVNPTGTATATLFACHPPGSAKFRYVVLLALAEGTQPSTTTTVAEPPTTQPPAVEQSPDASLPSEPAPAESGG